MSLGWSMNLFRVRGIQVAVHSTFFLLMAYVAWDGWQPAPDYSGGWAGVFWNELLLVTFFICVVLHELGHSLAAMRFGVGVRRILLMPIGGMAEFDSIPRQPAREIVITLAGPAVNFLIAGVLALVSRSGLLTAVGDDARAFADLLVHWNVIMGLFNLVPVFPMDGGRLLRAVLATRMSYLHATRVAARVGKVLAAIAILGAVFAPELGLAEAPSFQLAALFAFIFFAGELECRATERREHEEAHWRETFARLYGPVTPIDEPPPLS